MKLTKLLVLELDTNKTHEIIRSNTILSDTSWVTFLPKTVCQADLMSSKEFWKSLTAMFFFMPWVSAYNTSRIERQCSCLINIGPSLRISPCTKHSLPVMIAHWSIGKRITKKIYGRAKFRLHYQLTRFEGFHFPFQFVQVIPYWKQGFECFALNHSPESSALKNHSLNKAVWCLLWKRFGHKWI